MLLFLVAFMINNSWAQCNLTVNPSPSYPVCLGSCHSIHVSGAHTYLWAPGGMTDSIVSVCPSTTTTYTVTGTDLSSNTCSATTTITVNPNPVITATATPSTICSGATSSLSVTSSLTGTTYSWVPGGLSGISVNVNPSTTTCYTVVGTSPYGCTGSATVTVMVNPNPVLTVTATPPTICSGATSVLSVTSTVIGTTYFWVPGGLPGFPVYVTPSTTTTYSVTGTASGCTGASTVTVTVNPTPTVTVPANIVVCNGGTVPAASFTSSTPGATFNWMNTNTAIGIAANGMGNISSFTATNTTTSPITATITVNATANACSGPPSSYTITVNPAPAITASASPPSYCAGQSSWLTATGGTSYIWQPVGLTGSTISVHSSYTLTYTVTETSSGYNCSTTLTVPVYPNPVLTPTATPSTICSGASSTLGVSSTLTGTTYSWIPFSPYFPQVYPTATTTYTVTGTASGCTGTATVTVNVNPSPVITISPINPSICPGTCVALTAVGGSTYMWYPPGLSGPTQLVCPAATTTYTVYVTTSAGCTGTSTVTVTVSPPYTFTVAPADITLLPGQCTPLSIATAGTYIWTPSSGLSASTGANVTACPASTTTYSVTGTSADGCTAAAQTTVHITDKYIHEVSGSTACHLPYLAIFTIADAFVLSSDTIQYQFAFGDGTDTTFSRIYASDPAPLASLSHAYTATGSYSPVAILQHTGGLADTIQAANLINLTDTCGDISGKVFLDINHNCSADSGEYLMVNKLVKLYNSSHVLVQAQYTDAAGFYSFDVSGGTYTLAIDSSIYSSYSLYCPSGGSYAVSTLPATGKNFGADCLGDFDLYGHITGSTFHPGQNTNMYLTVGNNNCTPENAVAKFVPDPLTSFVTSSVSPSAIIGDTVCFAVNNLSSVNNPFKTIVVRVLTSASASVGDSLHFKLFIDPLTGDAVATNNTVIKKAIVTSSSKETLATSASGFNSKEVDPSGDITATTDLTYTIYFQNQGSATVANLFVLDTLDASLDLNTLQLIAASHSYTSQILTSGTRKIVKFLFANINLPDSSASPLLSNGFVTYQITPLSTAPQGTTISNKAGIYQDATPVIATNTVQNTIPLVTGESTKVISTPADRIYPNPASNTIIIELNNNTTTTASVYNLQGQLLMQQALTAPKTEMDIRSLPNGVYVIKLSSENGVTVKKFIKE